MRYPVLAALLTFSLVAVVPGPSAAAATTTPTDGTANGSATNGSDLLTEQELYDETDASAGPNTTATLYYVAANGTWYDAAPDGSIGQQAPDGDVVPNVEVATGDGQRRAETINLTASERPRYVWKVVEPCATTVYDAANGSVVSPIVIPGCSGLEERSMDRPTERTTGTTATSGATGPGFGLGTGLAALLAALLVASRR